MEVAKRPEDQRWSAASWTPEVDQLLRDWHGRMCACQHAYYLEAERLRRWHYWLGIPAVILSSIVGTAVFATLENEHFGIAVRLLVAVVSVTAAVLTGLQTFLRLAEAASANAVAADWYSAVKRDIEQLQAMRYEERGHPKECLDTLRKEINKVSEKAPELRESLWQVVAPRFGVGAGTPRPTRERPAGDLCTSTDARLNS